MAALATLRSAMTVLLLGIVLFLGVHSVRLVADGWRSRTVASLGEGPWKGLYSLASLAGFALLVWGYGMSRATPVVLWVPPPWTRHAAALLMLVSFVLLVATYLPRNGIKARVHHPMLLAVKVWALAHLLANGTLADVLLFGAFGVWAILLFRSSRRRDRAAAIVYPEGTAVATVLTVFIGGLAWIVFAFWAHAALIGVRPFG
jgi:uncharacterized membrane protein